MFNFYLEFNFDVLHAASNDRYANNIDIRLVCLGPNAFFSCYIFTTSSGKHLENIVEEYNVSLTYKLKTSAKGTADLYFGFDRFRERRIQELTINKHTKGNYHRRMYFKDIFGFAEHQEKATKSSVYRLTLKKILLTLF